MEAKKSLGQHFLTAPAVARRIAGSAGLTVRDTVVEIGPGRGMLTRELLRVAGSVIAVEKDEMLAEELARILAPACENESLTIITGDALSYDARALGLVDTPYALVANIPYYITGAIIRHILTDPYPPHTVVLLVQKEIAERIARSQKESVLSLSVKAYGTPAFIDTVSAACFTPRPRVDSAILRITSISRDRFADVDEELFFALVRAGFAHKRKLLIRNLETIVRADALREAFAAAGIPPAARAEDVHIDQWFALARAL